MNSRNNAYQRALVFSGGGTRFAIYCGMYAAWEDAGMKPDVLVAACGGAIAATIIQSFPTNAERKAYLMSEELYRFIRLQRLTEDSRLSRIGLLCLKKMRSKKAAPYMEDVFHTYLVDMPTDLSGGVAVTVRWVQSGNTNRHNRFGIIIHTGDGGQRQRKQEIISQDTFYG
ncbi:MAG: patatin-like phospholipase family protein [Bacteroides sp.]|nr:patatin-like phospholipase family protein [Bacteroides sp.]